MNDWQPIETAPIDGTLIKGKECDLSIPRLALYYCFYKDGFWHEMNFKTIEHPTAWMPCK